MTARRRGASTEHLPVRTDVSLLSEQDLFLFNEGTHGRLGDGLGAHPVTAADGETGTVFTVWAPDARTVSVIGDFNDWDPEVHPLASRGVSGIWEGFVPAVAPGALYKFRIVPRGAGDALEKADPFAVFSEIPPKTASIVWDLAYRWNDGSWMADRARRNALDAPMAIYEVHLGSWRHRDAHRSLSYRELADELPGYVHEMGFTHVELMPVMEHPYYGSWGYQTSGYFAPTGRFGTPQEFMALVDRLHQAGIGVILDWVPSHFSTDEHGLGSFDGTHLFEHADPRLGIHPDWGSYIFNYGRNEVRSFLISSALHWLSSYHADGLRVDAVASMLYLDYSRAEGEWIPNRYGGRENLDAIAFLRQLNEAVYAAHPDVQTVAEESTAWPMVSRPTYLGGLGFGLKWDMGWMHDTLEYVREDPINRKWHHDRLTFRSIYATNENFVLPLSHDEVVHGKGSLIGKMPGDEWQKFAGLRLLLGYLYGQSGKKLLFMGGELAQWREWSHDDELDWALLDHAPHAGMQRWVRDLNAMLRREPALSELDFEQAGFEWVEANDNASSVVSFVRTGRRPEDAIMVVGNFTPVPRPNYRLGVSGGGFWRELLNSDATLYGGSGQGNLGGVEPVPVPMHGRPRSVSLTVPPLACLFLKAEGAGTAPVAG